MKILVLAPFNPYIFSEFLNEPISIIPNINKGATAVNTLVKEFITKGHNVVVVTYNMDKTPVYNGCLCGENLVVEIVNQQCFLPKGMAFVRWYMSRRISKACKKYIGDCDVIHAHWTYDFALAACDYVKVKPVFCTVRDWAPYIFSLKKNIYWLVSFFIAKKVYRNKELNFIANSHYTFSTLHQAYPQKKITIIPNPIGNEYILEERNEYPDHMIFVSVSQSNDTRKNYDNLIIAFNDLRNKYLRDAELWLIGDGFTSENARCKDWTKKDLLEGVRLFGQINHKKVLELLDQSSAMIHPSLEETFGNILLEAMARRIPVIGGKSSGAVPYVLGEGKYGYLCDVTDIHDMTEKMYLLSNPNEFHKKINLATSYLLENYSSDIIIKKHISLYNDYIKCN